MRNELLALGVLQVLAACGPLGPESARDTGPRDGYPSGPYGDAEGEVIENLSFVLPDGEPWSLQDAYADGHNQLLLLSTAAGWCTACIEEQPALEALHTTHAGDGLLVVLSVFEDQSFLAADADYAAEWVTEHDVSFVVVADPDFVLADYYDESLTPMNMIIDVAAMEILKVTTGWDESLIESIVEARL